MCVLALSELPTCVTLCLCFGGCIPFVGTYLAHFSNIIIITALAEHIKCIDVSQCFNVCVRYVSIIFTIVVISINNINKHLLHYIYK